MCFIGSGRITFNNHKSYMKAVTAAFIEIKTPRFTKKVILQAIEYLVLFNVTALL